MGFFMLNIRILKNNCCREFSGMLKPELDLKESFGNVELRGNWGIHIDTLV
jgi:hypothetical protein